jgi:hypothetical protein
MPSKEYFANNPEARKAFGDKVSSAQKGKPKYGKRRATIEEDGITLYQCGKCKKFLPYSAFHKMSKTVLGICANCKKCARELKREFDQAGKLGINRLTVIREGVTLYLCASCNQMLPHSEYQVNSYSRHGIQSYCADCKLKYHRKKQGYNGRVYNKRMPPITENGITLFSCKDCQTYLPKESFTKQRSGPDGISYDCRTCQKKERGQRKKISTRR